MMSFGPLSSLFDIATFLFLYYFCLLYTSLREQICDVCHKMWQLGWVAANDGNVSARLDDGTDVYKRQVFV